MTIGHLDITSWRGISIGAVHWYAELIIHDETAPYGSRHIEMKRPITASEAKQMNLADKERGLLSSRYRAAYMTEGFNTEEEAIEAGKVYFNSHYEGVLFLGDSGCCSAWTNVILWHKDFDAIVKKMNTLAKRFQRGNGYEGNEDRARKIDDMWQPLYFKLMGLCGDKSYQKYI